MKQSQLNSGEYSPIGQSTGEKRKYWLVWLSLLTASIVAWVLYSSHSIENNINLWNSGTPYIFSEGKYTIQSTNKDKSLLLYARIDSSSEKGIPDLVSESSATNPSVVKLASTRRVLHSGSFSVIPTKDSDCFRLRAGDGHFITWDLVTGLLLADGTSEASGALFGAVVVPSSEADQDSSGGAHNSTLKSGSTFPSNKKIDVRLRMCDSNNWIQLDHVGEDGSDFNESSFFADLPPAVSIWQRLFSFKSKKTDTNWPAEAIPIFTFEEVPQLRGVNLGGWFIPEVWMSRSFYNGTGLGWGGSLCAIVKYDKVLAEKRMRHILDTWIIEKDIKEIAGMGFNSIRLPIGYWNVINDPYQVFAPAKVETSLHYIDWLFDMADKYRLTILMDIHGAPGSQNGIDHSGCGQQPSFLENPSNVELALQAVAAIIKRYGSRVKSTLVGIELLNEPSYPYSQKSHSQLRDFYIAAYKLIRSNTAYDNIVIVFNELYEDFYESWRNELREPDYFNVVMDIHLYDWQLPYTFENNSQHIADAMKWKEVVKKQSTHHPIIIGEWCMSTGTFTQAGQTFVDVCVDSFSQSFGWYLWNWKIERVGFDEWDVQYQHRLPSGKGLNPMASYSPEKK